VLIQASWPGGGAIALGADVLDEQGTIIGMVGQGGQVYARAEADSGHLQVRWGAGPDQACLLPFDVNSSNAHDSQGFIHLKSICTPNEEPT